MQQFSNFDPTKPPVGQRRCPKCGLPMSVSHIAELADDGQHTFECSTCEYAEMVVAA